MNDILNVQNIHQLQLDITSYCNSFCPGCARNIHGGRRILDIPLVHMDWEIWCKIVEFVSSYGLKLLQFNGNYGDAINHPNLLKMLEYAIDKNLQIFIHTNGGARNTEFWVNLAKILKEYDDSSHVIFSIDGLADTNHIHRRSVDFDTLISNCKAFINNGGSAKWRMIVFKHNLHQVEEASLTAKKLGFDAFYLNRSYAKELYMEQYNNLPKGVVYGVDNEDVKKLKKIYKFDKNPRKNPIFLHSKCPWQQERRVQITIDNSVQPCCYHALIVSEYPQMTNREEIYTDPMYAAYEKYGPTFNNLKYHTLFDILSHDFFQIDLPKFWNNRLSHVCKHQCGV